MFETHWRRPDHSGTFMMNEPNTGTEIEEEGNPTDAPDEGGEETEIERDDAMAM